MSCWQDYAIPMLRALIGDLDYSSLDYTDERLETILVVSGTFVTREARLGTTYTVNVPNNTISPDPSSDIAFLNLMSLKAACMIDRGNARSASAIAGLEARCGPAVMKTDKHFDAFLALLKEGYCKAYENSVFEHNLGNTSYTRAILSPFVNRDFFPEHHNLSHFVGDDIQRTER